MSRNVYMAFPRQTRKSYLNWVNRRHPNAQGKYLVRFGRRSTKYVASTYKKSSPVRSLQKGVFKPNMTVNFRYDIGQEKMSNSGDATKDYAYYKANGIYNPTTGAGGSLQPRYFDSLLGANDGTAPYRDYVVTSCSASVTFMNTTTVDVLVGMGFRDSSITTPSTWAEIRERPYYKSVVLRTVTAGSNNTKTLSMTMPMTKLYGVKKSGILDDPDYAGNYQSNPSKVALVDVWMIPLDPNNTVAFDIYYDVRIKYTTRVSSLNDVADSVV